MGEAFLALTVLAISMLFSAMFALVGALSKGNSRRH